MTAVALARICSRTSSRIFDETPFPGDQDPKYGTTNGPYASVIRPSQEREKKLLLFIHDRAVCNILSCRSLDPIERVYVCIDLCFALCRQSSGKTLDSLVRDTPNSPFTRAAFFLLFLFFFFSRHHNDKRLFKTSTHPLTTRRKPPFQNFSSTIRPIPFRYQRTLLSSPARYGEARNEPPQEKNSILGVYFRRAPQGERQR